MCHGSSSLSLGWLEGSFLWLSWVFSGDWSGGAGGGVWVCLKIFVFAAPSVDECIFCFFFFFGQKGKSFA